MGIMFCLINIHNKSIRWIQRNSKTKYQNVGEKIDVFLAPVTTDHMLEKLSKSCEAISTCSIILDIVHVYTACNVFAMTGLRFGNQFV